ncbi:MAG: hypothetical protein PHW60_03950 [Kiritimatiellae bacterium]|nr:hypothetical protein [Kiritimatiellia bacterium]
MSDKFSPVDLLLDANTRSRCVDVGDTLQVPDEYHQIDLHYGSQYLFMAKVCKGKPSMPYVFTENTAFYWGADSVYNHTPYPISSVNDQFHIAGDFAFDPAKGLICWRANLATSELLALLNETTNPSLLFHHYLWALPPDIDSVLIATWDTLIWLPAVNAAIAAPAATQYERRKDGRTQVLFSDGKWRTRYGVLVDGNPAETWGDPED